MNAARTGRGGPAKKEKDGTEDGGEWGPTESKALEGGKEVKKFYDFGFSSFSASGGRFRAPGPLGIDPGRNIASDGPRERSGDRF